MSKPNKAVNVTNRALDTYISVGVRVAAATIVTAVIVSFARKIRG